MEAILKYFKLYKYLKTSVWNCRHLQTMITFISHRIRYCFTFLPISSGANHKSTYLSRHYVFFLFCFNSVIIIFIRFDSYFLCILPLDLYKRMIWQSDFWINMYCYINISKQTLLLTLLVFFN